MFTGILTSMKRGGYPGAADGFTIVEVLIVLAVSSILFISAVNLIDGRQARAEFTTGSNDELQQMQQLINETASGYYPNSGDFTCTGSAAGPVSLSLAAHGSTSQGSNAGCIFLGKVIQFGIGPDYPQSNTLGILPVVGNQYQSTGGVLSPVLTVAASTPRAVYPADSGEYSNVPTDTSAQDVLEYGLQLANGNSSCGLGTSAVCYSPASGGGFVRTGIAAFISGDISGNIAASAAGSSTNLQSGSEPMSLYGVKTSAVGNSLETASADMGPLSRSTGLGNLDPATEILICLADPDTSQSGLYTISGSGDLSVTLTVKSGLTC
jgi:prepilin-type N-terminal cleavage/methylation domain-containing protein